MKASTAPSSATSLWILARCQPAAPDGPSVADTPVDGSAAEGVVREHIIDDEAIGGAPIRGGDGLVMADLDLDGHLEMALPSGSR